MMFDHFVLLFSSLFYVLSLNLYHYLSCQENLLIFLLFTLFVTCLFLGPLVKLVL